MTPRPLTLREVLAAHGLHASPGNRYSTYRDILDAKGRVVLKQATEGEVWAYVRMLERK